jgi:dihydroorotase
VPPIDTPERFGDRIRDAGANSWCNFAINSGVTAQTALERMWQAGAMAFGETFFAPSSYGGAIGDAALSRAMERIHGVDGLLTVHAEEVSDMPDTGMISHDQSRSPEGELTAVKAIRRLNKTGCRIHFCHLSTGRSLDAASGSVEVTPHHLFLSLEDFEDTDSFGKVNPPLRSERERKNLWARWDRIDVIASDHAPHTREEKAQDFSLAPSGIPGVETLLPLLLARVIDGKIPLQSVVKKTSSAPADLLGIPRAGFSVGDRADFALFGKFPTPVTAEMLHSKCGWTPFEGHLAVFPTTVVMGGKVVYHKGDFFRTDPPHWFSGKGYEDKKNIPDSGT